MHTHSAVLVEAKPTVSNENLLERLRNDDDVQEVEELTVGFIDVRFKQPLDAQQLQIFADRFNGIAFVHKKMLKHLRF